MHACTYMYKYLVYTGKCLVNCPMNCPMSIVVYLFSDLTILCCLLRIKRHSNYAMSIIVKVATVVMVFAFHTIQESRTTSPCFFKLTDHFFSLEMTPKPWS